jgi:hypothetical protein
MSDNDDKKTDKVPIFRGQSEKFPQWWARFRSFATIKGILPAIQKDPEPDLPKTAVRGDNETKKQKDARERNNRAVHWLNFALEGEHASLYWYLGQTPDWPDGAGFLIVRALLEQFIPADDIAEQEFAQALWGIKMQPTDDPVTLFAQVRTLQNTFGMYTYPERQLIHAIIAALPTEYRSAIAYEEIAQDNTMTYSQIQKCATMYYRKTYGRKCLQTPTPKKNQDPEVALPAAATPSKAYRKMKCFRCGKQGHRKKDCRSKIAPQTNVKCGRCHRMGHSTDRCWFDPKNTSRRPAWFQDKSVKKEDSASTEVSHVAVSSDKFELLCCGIDEQLFPTSIKLLQDPNIWIGDTGASVDMTPYADGITDAQPSNVSVHVGNNEHTAATHCGTLPVTICNNTGEEMYDASFPNMHLVPAAPYNIISITQRMENGWTLGGSKDTGIVLTKNGHTLMFDIKITTRKGVLWASCMKRRPLETAAIAPATYTQLNVQQAHGRLGHMSENSTRQAAKALGWKLAKGSMPPCENCAIGKGRQKNIPKDTGGPIASLTAPRAYLDCCTLTDKLTRKVKYVWRLLVLYPAQLKISDIFKSKNSMVEPTLAKLQKLLQLGVKVKYLRMDNGGENKLLADRMMHKDWKLPIVVEWTARDTPQQNSPAEVAFATLAGRARAMMEDANVPDNLRFFLMPEAVKTATYLDNLIPIEIDGVLRTRFQHHFGVNPPFAKSLRTWGEAGTVTIKSRKFQPKEKGRGVTCMMIGYSPDHPTGTYRMYDPNTRGVHMSRDVTWLRRKFFPSTLLEAGEGVVMPLGQHELGQHEEDNHGNDNDYNDNVDTCNGNRNEDEDDNYGTHDDFITRSGRRSALPAYLRAEYETSNTGPDFEITLTAAEERYYEAMSSLEYGLPCIDHNDIGVEEAMVGAGIGGGYANTNELHTHKYEDAMASVERPLWVKAVEEEFHNMEEHGVFQPIDRSLVPPGAKILSTTWVLKKKASGRYKARVTARGFEQVDGEHFDSADKASPVVNDVTIRLVMTIIVMAGMWAEIVDVKGAFLTATFEPGHTINAVLEEVVHGDEINRCATKQGRCLSILSLDIHGSAYAYKLG